MDICHLDTGLIIHITIFYNTKIVFAVFIAYSGGMDWPREIQTERRTL